MTKERKSKAGTKFFIVQAGLIIITAILVVVCAIPFFHLMSDAIGKQRLADSLHRSDLEVASLESQMAKLNALQLMGRTDSITDEDVRKQLEELQRKLVAAEKENQQLKQQMDMVSTLLTLVNAQRSGQDSTLTQQTHPAAQSQSGQVSSRPQVPAEGTQKVEAAKTPDRIIDNIVSAGDQITSTGEKIVAFGDKMTLLVTKLIGTVASFFTGMAVLIRWVKKKPTPKEQAS